MLDIGKAARNFSNMELPTAFVSVSYFQIKGKNIHSPWFENSPGFSNAIYPIEAHQAEGTNNDVYNLTFT